MKKIFLALALLAGLSQAMPKASRVTLPSGKAIFVSGINLAWVNYAADVGGAALDSLGFDTAMKAVQDSGGNAMRIWLSTDGTHDPVYNSTTGLVSGPGSRTISNIQMMLRLAKRHNIVLCLDLMTHQFMNIKNPTNILNNNVTLLTTTNGLNAYITNYLTPLVTAIDNDPNLLCWEVFNEPEGMVNASSWGLHTAVSEVNVQTDINRIAAAIHKAVPKVLVSSGANTIGDLRNYTDVALTAAGGDATGTLDFYMAHYYCWVGTSNSPFTKAYASLNLDKPLVIGEYASSSWTNGMSVNAGSCSDGANVDTLLPYLDKAGYAGGMGWPFKQDRSDPWMKGFPTFGHSIRQEWRADSNSIKITGGGASNFAVSAVANSGGLVTASPVGRIDSGNADTLKAAALAGYNFTGWSGDTAGTNISGVTLIIPKVTKDLVIQANFVPGAGTNLVQGGTFTGADSANWGFYAATGNVASVSYANSQASINISTSDTLNYDIQLKQDGISVLAGVTYILSYDAWSTGARDLVVGLSEPAHKYHWFGGVNASLSSTKTTFSGEITPDSTDNAAQLQVDAGKSTLPVYIDNVTLVKQVTALAPRSTLRSAPTWSLQHSGANLLWTRSQALQAAGVVRLVGIDGRELSRAAVAAGAKSGSLKAPGSGIAFLVLESADVREIQALPLAR